MLCYGDITINGEEIDKSIHRKTTQQEKKKTSKRTKHRKAQRLIWGFVPFVFDAHGNTLVKITTNVRNRQTILSGRAIRHC